MLYRNWVLAPQNAGQSETMAAQIGAGKLLCDVLVARGIATPEAARAMLDETPQLPSCFLLRDMEKAVQRIRQAVDEDEAMVVFGDYDVDGITATALLYSYLEAQGACVYYKLPNRTDDGYGLTPALVDQVADMGISLIITVDNGTSAFEACERAAQRGVDVVVTDHHLPQGHLPEVAALVNPHREDDDSPFEGLSGVGVAFLLAAALEGATAEEMLPIFGDFVAIGTVADVMKLVGINRQLVRTGLATLRDTQRPGLAALIEACGWKGRDITVENISYGLAPRLNAAGRMDTATTALRLLLTDDGEEAAEIVESLQAQNAARQQAEQEITAAIVQQVEADAALQRARILVVWGSNWHQGVIGIVASRLVEKYAKPAVVISFDGDAPDGVNASTQEGRGSGRSFAGLSLYGAIASCEDLLVRYGGHDLAAGLSIERGNLEAFRKRVNDWAKEYCPVLTLPELVADTTVQLATLQVEDVQGLERLAPFGSGNPAPKFLVQNAVVDAIYPVSEGRHSRLRLKQRGGTLYAMQFGVGPEKMPYAVGDAVDALVALSIYNGKAGRQISARIIEMRPAGLGQLHVQQSALYESFAAEVKLTGEQKQLLCPTREEVGAVYRAIRGEKPVSALDIRPLAARLGEEKTGKYLAALAALEELGLVQKEGATARYTAPRATAKKDLAESTILQRLEV